MGVKPRIIRNLPAENGRTIDISRNNLSCEIQEGIQGGRIRVELVMILKTKLSDIQIYAAYLVMRGRILSGQNKTDRSHWTSNSVVKNY